MLAGKKLRQVTKIYLEVRLKNSERLSSFIVKIFSKTSDLHKLGQFFLNSIVHSDEGYFSSS